MANGFTQRFKGRIAGIGDSIFSAGKGAAVLKPGGGISVNVTSGSSAATASAQTLATYSIPANSLDAAGRGVEIKAFGTKAANAAPVNLGLAIGGASFTTGNSTQSGVSWMMSGIYYRNGQNVQEAAFDAVIGAVPAAASVVADTATETSAIVVNVTATDASAATGNVVFKGLIVKFFN